jgi:TolB protein
MRARPGRPDGSRLAFIRDLPDQWTTIFTVGADGSGVTQVAPGGCEMDPAWSPKGTKIAFAGCGGLFASGIWTMNTDGTNPVRIAEVGYEPAWSPDGSRIAYSRGAPADIYSIGADGSDERQLTSRHLGDIDPTWSPDGTQMPFTACFRTGG